MTNPNEGRNIAVQTIGANAHMIAEIQEKNTKLKARGVGFTIDIATLHSAASSDIQTLLARVNERYNSTFNVGDTGNTGQEEDSIVSDIIELADEHQLSEIHIGSSTYSLMLEPLSNVSEEVLSEILDALSVESGKVELTYTQGIDAKIDDLIGANRVSLSALRNMTDENILSTWESWYEETNVTSDSDEEVGEEQDYSGEEVPAEGIYGKIATKLLTLRKASEEAGFPTLGAVRIDGELFDLATGKVDSLENASDADLEKILTVIENRLRQLSMVDESDESDESDTDLDTSISDSTAGENIYSQLETDLEELREYNTEKGFAPLGLIQMPNFIFDLDAGDVDEVLSHADLQDQEVVELVSIINERQAQLESYIECMSQGESGEDYDDSDEDELGEDFDIDDEDLEEHLSNPEFDEIDQLGLVTISNKLVLNFPVNAEGSAAFADRDLRKELSSVKGYVYNEDEELVELEQTCNTLNLTSKKTNGWLRPALGDIVKYLNRLNGSIPTFVADGDNAAGFACSLGDSISDVLQVLPLRSAFGQLVDVSGVVDEDGDIHNGLDDRYTLNNFLTMANELGQLDIDIVNHFTIDALTVHHKEVSTALKSLLNVVSTRASVANFPVVTTFTFDAVEAMTETNDIYQELLSQGFNAVSRSEVTELLEEGAEHEVLELLGLTDDNYLGEDYNLDVVFGNADILLYLPTVNL